MNAIIVNTGAEFFEAYRKFGNEKGTWIVWADNTEKVVNK